MTEEADDKTLAPTQRRRQEARRDGQVARSADLVAACVMLAAMLSLRVSGPALIAALRGMIAHGFEPGAFYQPVSWAGAMRVVTSVGLAMLPILAALVVVAIAGNLMQVGFLFSFKLKPESLSPAKNLARIFSGRSVSQVLLSTATIAAVIAVAYSATSGVAGQIVSIERLPGDAILGAGGKIIFTVGVRVALTLLALGGIDYAIQRWRHERDLRMTRREMTDELRQFEIHPANLRRRKGLATTIAGAQMEPLLADADVLILHEDHMAVAIRYDRRTMRNPQIVAKAGGVLVPRARELAAKHGVAIVEREPLARALFKLGGIGAPVPAKLFGAVAEVLAYVDELRRADGGRS